MAIIKSITTDVFDVSAVKKNDFIRARHKSWAEDDVVNGLVASVSEKEIIVAYLPEVRNVRSHFFYPCYRSCRGPVVYNYIQGLNGK